MEENRESMHKRLAKESRKIRWSSKENTLKVFVTTTITILFFVLLLFAFSSIILAIMGAF